ncbi:MAG: 2-phospho-L-lactate guanylyltransferase [Acidimicrobiia bacterium]|nr:2-phospho-L-lactate guanylyltransferase [Acidimicrobiia bacterium]
MLDPALPPDGERRLAVVPQKSFATAKARLRGVLPEGERARVAEAMATHVIDTLVAVLPTAVVSADRGVLDLAASRGAWPIEESGDDGLNAAVTEAVWEAQGLAVHTLAVVAGDLARIEIDDVYALLRLPSRPGVVVAPDRSGTGTNAIVLSPPEAIDVRFGPNSMRAHVAAAYRANLPVRVLRRPGLQLDVDTPDDFPEGLRRRALPPVTGTGA